MKDKIRELEAERDALLENWKPRGRTELPPQKALRSFPLPLRRLRNWLRPRSRKAG